MFDRSLQAHNPLIFGDKKEPALLKAGKIVKIDDPVVIQ